MNERRRLQRVAGGFTSKIGSGSALQLPVNKRDEAIPRGQVAASPRLKQAAGIWAVGHFRDKDTIRLGSAGPTAGSVCTTATGVSKFSSNCRVTPEMDVRVAAGAAVGILMWGGYGQERLAAQNGEPLPRQEAISPGANQNLAERPTLVIHVEDRTHLKEGDRDTAEKEVMRIYAAAGVRAMWSDGFPLATETDTFAHVTVFILDDWATDMTAGEPRGSSLMGRAARGTGRAYIFYPRLESAARLRHRHVGMVLGAAIAHEVGHLLLSKNSHSNIGIMRQDLNLKSLLPLDVLGFTPAQSADIRKTLRMWPHRTR